MRCSSAPSFRRQRSASSTCRAWCCSLSTLPEWSARWRRRGAQMTVSKGLQHPLLLELPSYRLAALRNLLIGLLERAKIFLLRVGNIILALTVLLWFLSSFPGAAGRRYRPGHPVQLRRHAGPGARSRLRADRLQLADLDRAGPRHGGARSRRRRARHGLRSLGDDGDDVAGQLGPLLAAGWSLPTAFSLLAWYVFAPQCLATLAAVKRETNSWRYPLLMAGYLFALAYLASSSPIGWRCSWPGRRSMPTSSYAARLRIDPDPAWYAMLAVTRGIPSARIATAGPNVSWQKGAGSMLIGEVGFSPVKAGLLTDRPGSAGSGEGRVRADQQAGYWGCGATPRVFRNWLPSMPAASRCWRRTGAPMFSPNKPCGVCRSRTVIWRHSSATVSPTGKTNSLDYSLSAGLSFRGPFAGREKDTFGIAATRAHAGPQGRALLSDELGPAAVVDRETAVEMTYRACNSPPAWSCNRSSSASSIPLSLCQTRPLPGFACNWRCECRRPD
jgi:hypothetical protein